MRSWKPIASLLVVAVVALSGCGGGPVSSPGSNPPTVREESGTLTLPQGARVRPEQLSVYTNWGIASVASDGRFSLPVNSEGSQLVVAVNSNDVPVLLGIRQFTDAFQINSSTTAAAVLMLVYPYLFRDNPSDVRRAYDVIQRQSFFAQIVQAVEAQLGQLGYLEPEEEPLRGALLNAATPVIDLLLGGAYPPRTNSLSGRSRVGRRRVDPNIPPHGLHGMQLDDASDDLDGRADTHDAIVYNWSPTLAVAWSWRGEPGNLPAHDGEEEADSFRPVVLDGATEAGLFESFRGEVGNASTEQLHIRFDPSWPEVRPGEDLWSSPKGKIYVFAVRPGFGALSYLDSPEGQQFRLRDAYAAADAPVEGRRFGRVTARQARITLADVTAHYVLMAANAMVGKILEKRAVKLLYRCVVQIVGDNIDDRLVDLIQRGNQGQVDADTGAKEVLRRVLEVLQSNYSTVIDCVLERLNVSEVVKEKLKGKVVQKLLKFADLLYFAVNEARHLEAYKRPGVAVWRVYPDRTPVRWITPGEIKTLTVKRFGEGSGTPVILAGGQTSEGKPFVWTNKLLLRVVSDQPGEVLGVCVSDTGDLAAVGYLGSGAAAFQWVRRGESAPVFEILPSGGSTSGNVAYGCSWRGASLHVVGRTAPEFPYATYWIDGRIYLRRRWDSRCPNGMIFLDVAENLSVVGAVGVWYPEPTDNDRGCRELRRHLFIWSGGAPTVIVEGGGGASNVYPYWARISRDGSSIIGRFESGQGFLIRGGAQMPLPGTPYGTDGSYVVGSMFGQAYRWQGGAQLLNDIFRDHLGSGFSLTSAWGISADGRFIGGGGIRGAAGQWAYIADAELARR